MPVDKNPDGSDSPMDEPYYEAEQIAPGTWRILSSGDYSYLVAGENEAVSIDTGYFEKAYMAEAGVPYASQPYDSFAGIDFPQDYQRVGIKEGFVYDLGGRTLEVFDIPDHTTDGIALLDRKERLLFTGDEFMVRGKHLNVPLLVFLEYLEKLAAHWGITAPISSRPSRAMSRTSGCWSTPE